MDSNPIPISMLFIGLNGLIAFVLSYIVVMERTRTRIWHGASQEEITAQPDYLAQPNGWAQFIENYTQKSVTPKTSDDGLLQRKMCAFSNFIEYVPLGLLFILASELAGSVTGLTWLMGVALTIARIAHAWGLIKTYGPSPGRAIGFFLTWFVYLVGITSCLYYGVVGILK
ncbi:MAG: MAPEG family protein [Microcoleaceae cyanobacterium]